MILTCKKRGDNVQKKIIKAGKAERFQIVAVSTDYMKKEDKHTAMLLVRDTSKKSGGSEIVIKGETKEMVSAQVKEMIKIFPPTKDIVVIDLQEVMNHEH